MNGEFLGDGTAVRIKLAPTEIIIRLINTI
jgi:hypothetical protein